MIPAVFKRGKCFCNVECHCIGPKEETHKGMMNNESNGFTSNCVKDCIPIKYYQAVADDQKDVTNDDIDEEPNCQYEIKTLFVLYVDTWILNNCDIGPACMNLEYKQLELIDKIK